MLNKAYCVKINGDVQKYIDRARELGFSQHYSTNNCRGYIKLYYSNMVFNIFDDNFAFENEITQKEFFETMNKKMNPQDVFEVVKSFGYTHICQNSDSVFAISGIVSKNGNSYRCEQSRISSRLLAVEINWPDKENMIYPELPDHKVVKLNNEYEAKVYKNKIVVGCQTFPICILQELTKALKSLG